MEQRLEHEGAWVATVSDPRTTVLFPLHGYDTVAPDWEFEDRVLDDHLVYLVTAGGVSARIEDETVELGPGDLLWMQPSVRHTFRLAGPEGLTVYFVRFRLQSAARSRADPAGPGLRPVGPSHRLWRQATELRPLMDELVDELSTQLTHRELRARALVVALTTAVLRHRDEEGTTRGTLSRGQRRALEDLVRARPSERLTPTDLAGAVGLSLGYFTRLFTATFGTPPRSWLVDERLRRAALALADSLLTVREVSRSVGYDDVTAFSHQFRQRYGASPRSYRPRAR